MMRKGRTPFKATKGKANFVSCEARTCTHTRLTCQWAAPKAAKARLAPCLPNVWRMEMSQLGSLQRQRQRFFLAGLALVGQINVAWRFALQAAQFNAADSIRLASLSFFFSLATRHSSRTSARNALK